MGKECGMRVWLKRLKIEEQRFFITIACHVHQSNTSKSSCNDSSSYGMTICGGKMQVLNAPDAG